MGVGESRSSSHCQRLNRRGTDGWTDGWMDGCGRRLRTHGWENGSMISILVGKAMYAHPGPVLRPSLSDPSGACRAYLVSYWTRTTSRASKLASDIRRTAVSTGPGPCFALNDLHIPALESRATDTDSLVVTCVICRRFGSQYICRGLVSCQRSGEQVVNLPLLYPREGHGTPLGGGLDDGWRGQPVALA